MTTSRRALISGLTGFVACAPAIVLASSLMPIKPMYYSVCWTSWETGETVEVAVDFLTYQYGMYMMEGEADFMRRTLELAPA